VLIAIDGESAFADPQAAITWSQRVKTDVNLKTLVDRGSGETSNSRSPGSGWLLLLQPSEGAAGSGCRHGRRRGRDRQSARRQ
jgi:hypothetical protein